MPSVYCFSPPRFDNIDELAAGLAARPDGLTGIRGIIVAGRTYNISVDCVATEQSTQQRSFCQRLRECFCCAYRGQRQAEQEEREAREQQITTLLQQANVQQTRCVIYDPSVRFACMADFESFASQYPRLLQGLTFIEVQGRGYNVDFFGYATEAKRSFCQRLRNWFDCHRSTREERVTAILQKAKTERIFAYIPERCRLQRAVIPTVRTTMSGPYINERDEVTRL